MKTVLALALAVACASSSHAADLNLESLPVAEIATDWPFGKAKYEGVLLRDVVQTLPGPAKADYLVVHCKDQFQAFIPLELIRKYPVGIVTKVDGKKPEEWPSYKGRRMEYYVGLPSVKHPELDDPKYGNLWAWQIERLELVSMRSMLKKAYIRVKNKYTGFLAMGQKAFVEQCIHCHSALGAGSKKSSDLTEVISLHNAESFKKFVSDPKSVNPDSRMPAFERVLSSGEMGFLFSYLEYLAKR